MPRDIADFMPSRLSTQIGTAAAIGVFGLVGARVLSPPETPASVLGQNTAVDVCTSELYSLGSQATAQQLGGTACNQFKSSFNLQGTDVTVYGPADSDGSRPVVAEYYREIYKLEMPHQFRADNYTTRADIADHNRGNASLIGEIGVGLGAVSLLFMRLARRTDPRRHQKQS